MPHDSVGFFIKLKNMLKNGFYRIKYDSCGHSEDIGTIINITGPCYDIDNNFLGYSYSGGRNGIYDYYVVEEDVEWIMSKKEVIKNLIKKI